MIVEGPENEGAEAAMLKAGFTWFYGDRLVRIDSLGKRIVTKIPSQNQYQIK
ncbi:MAG: hypothetical protein JXB18_04005 [Sedimentisphaerales bacterium]|nr:hypothetical protein [Sedimentisphaerales bacterium]